MEWNAHFTYFVSFLCGFTESLIPLMKKVCSLEVSAKLLFQRPMPEIQQVGTVPYIPVCCVFAIANVLSYQKILR